LIADDDDDVLELVQLSLRPGGYRLIVAHDGEEALQAARQHCPDLAVLDVTMPRMTGYEVVEAMRADPTISNVPVFLLTARAQQADIEHGLALGADEYISKPFKPRDLRARVESVLATGRPAT
jgi:two-component system phosphate regulon response regulator PhoB